MQSFSNLFHLNQHSPTSHHHVDMTPPTQHSRPVGFLGHYHHHFSQYHPTPSPSISVESYPDSPSDDSSPSFSSSLVESFKECSTSPKAEYSSSPKEIKRHASHHHHHSIQELIGHFKKKVIHWRSENGYRRSSCSESEADDSFRGRSKSLDCNTKRPVVATDCESTYRIYNTILKEGAQLKQRSLDPDRRRQSVGTIIPTNIHRASDAFLDPHHAAILFRDSRGIVVTGFTYLSTVTLAGGEIYVSVRGERPTACHHQGGQPDRVAIVEL
ncbi:hypothetical protein GWI33_016921 [Rhynchophorus ferrugineus]|uniref:Uncharacterized protein n=1 Tax=Rhynchophorus ferrugineus TaxID=354439 RepID=A0A834M873_RHYFE|nr:hypothetical protein GWI33_016921 [Rhynchophorus ferrugineus]